MRKSTPVSLLLLLSLLSPLAGILQPVARARTRPAALKILKKMTEALERRIEQARPGSNERTRVIINVQEGAAGERARTALQNAGANLRGNLDSLGMLVADVPVEKLKELSARDEI